jgi:hypothetical protein
VKSRTGKTGEIKRLYKVHAGRKICISVNVQSSSIGNSVVWHMVRILGKKLLLYLP